MLGSGSPDFIPEIINELHNGGWPLRPQTIRKSIEIGLKKLMKYFKIEIPEKSNNREENKISTPHIQNILYSNQLMTNDINISNELKIEIDTATTQFIEELNKPNPNPSKLKKFYDTIKKGLGPVARIVIEELLKKSFGI